jgi:hypothetical protein
MGSKSLLVFVVLSAVACGGGEKHSTEPTNSMETAKPVTTAAPVETAAPTATTPAAATTSAPASDAPKYTFSKKDFAAGMVVEFARNSRHQTVPLKDGKPGKVSVSEKMLGGTITVKEVDANKNVTAAEVAFLPTSTESPMSAPTAAAPAAAFYAGKKFLVKKGAGATGLEITDEKGKPALKNAMEMSFIGSVVSQVVPFSTFGYGHGLSAKLSGRTLAVGDKVDDLVPSMPTMIFSKSRTLKLAAVRDSGAVFELHGEDARESQNKEGAVAFKGASQGDATIVVPVATSQWTSLKVKRASQSENVAAKSEYTWEEESTLTRTFK